MNLPQYIITYNKQTDYAMGVKLLNPVIENTQDSSILIEGITYPITKFVPEGSQILAFASNWGREFSPQWYRLDERKEALLLTTDQGRSSHGYSPMIYLFQADGNCISVAICWSGNWGLRICPEGKIEFVLLEKDFTTILEPNESFKLPSIICSRSDSFTELCNNTSNWLEQNWFAESRINSPIVEWNHWWTYEDVDINEDVFLKNVDRAAELGFTLCTLDAGWFGDETSDVHWSKCRGDWYLINRKRFPQGLRYISDYVHQKGMKFGIWIEPEAMGKLSVLRQLHPEWEAIYDGKEYEDPYLCLGAEGAAEWLFEIMDRLVIETNCDWIKLDFNVDPGYGCNRSDHGHQPGMGLYTHYQKYYEVLDRLRSKYPHLILENCSSGGLRFDLEMLKHTDVTYLSDPDELAHSLQCFWGASLTVSPSRLLHWAWSQTREYEDGSHVFPGYEIEDNTPEYEVIATLRSAMLHLMGVSRDLTTLPLKFLTIFTREIKMYKEKIFPLLFQGSLYHLTGQPLRYGERVDDFRKISNTSDELVSEDNFAAFQLMKKGKGAIFAFAVKKSFTGEIMLEGVLENAEYLLENADTRERFFCFGRELLEQGVHLNLEVGHSGLWFISILK